MKNVLMNLRKCSNHPYLCGDIEPQANSYVPPFHCLLVCFSLLPLCGCTVLISDATRNRQEEAITRLVNVSGKLLLLDKMLAKLKERGHRVLIFSQFKIMLDIIDDLFTFRGYKFFRLVQRD